MRLYAACALGVLLLTGAPAKALERLTFERDGKTQALAGQAIVTAQDGGVLLRTADGALWTIEPQEIKSRSNDDEPFVPLGPDELSKALLAELPEGFDIHATHHYLICYNTSREYATWCGALFERLYLAFTNFWSRKGLKLSEPEFPLVAIVFDSRASYASYSRGELGEGAESIVGYYSLRSNRITMYDLTGVQSLRSPGDRRGSAAQINQMLSRPEAEQLVATIIHEATHQIAFNSGMQRRLADIPLWVCEGLAVYFETPDLQSGRGWRTIGAVNTSRLDRFREYMDVRPDTSLKSLIVDDKRIRDARTALDAYAEAWALNYYLIRQKPKQYLAYLELLSRKKELMWDDPETRLAEFQQVFGENLNQLDADFVRQIEKLRQ